MKINGIQPKSEELNTNGKSYTKITITAERTHWDFATLW